MFYIKLKKDYRTRIFIIFLSLLYIILIDYKKHDSNKFKRKNLSPTISDEKNNSTKNNLIEDNDRNKILSKGRKFLDKCLKSDNNNFYEKSDNPIITTIIPSYNCQKTISSSVRSVQYQNCTNIEIIIVDDFSTDKSREIIRNIQLKDKRLVMIENKKNMGTLYSRCIGALLSKGEYIFCLDNDDLFFDEDVFDYVYKESKKDNLDIVSFRALYFNDYFDDIYKMKNFHFFNFQNNLFLTQPKLGIWTLTLNGKYRMHNHMIWSKSIKTNIYIKAVNILGIQRYSKYVCWAEDTSINFIIFNIAMSFKYVYKFGYIHIVKRTSATFTQNINNKLYGELFYLDIMFEFLKNNSEKNFVVEEALRIKDRYRINKVSNNTNSNYLKSILYKIINSQFINIENKKRIKFYFKNFFINF